MLNSNIINIITTLYFKNKFNNVVKQINRIQNEYCEIQHDYCGGGKDIIHTITIKKKKYDIEFSYHSYWTCKIISRAGTYYEISGAYVDDPPLALRGGWSDDLWDYCCYARNTDDINHLKEMERNVINYFNTLKPMPRTIKIKK